MNTYRLHRDPTPVRTLAVESGEVMCPREGPVDIERCWLCPAYDGLSAGHIEGLVCRVDRLPAVSPVRVALP